MSMVAHPNSEVCDLAHVSKAAKTESKFTSPVKAGDDRLGPFASGMVGWVLGAILLAAVSGLTQKS
jgi:hypothetical protein